MISLYRPGDGILHCLPAGAKLAGLVVATLVLSLYPHDGFSVTAALLVVATGYFVAGLGWRPLARAIWQLRYLVLVLAVFLAVFVSPQTAWINTVRMVAILLLAGLVTMTTRASDLLEVLHGVLIPLRRVGVNADAVALTLLLTITMVPVIASFSERLREAQLARGVGLGVQQIVPLFVMSLRHADDVGDALAARGLA